MASAIPPASHPATVMVSQAVIRTTHAASTISLAFMRLRVVRFIPFASAVLRWDVVQPYRTKHTGPPYSGPKSALNAPKPSHRAPACPVLLRFRRNRSTLHRPMSRRYLIPDGTGPRVKARRLELELTQDDLGKLVSRHVKTRYGWDKKYSDSWVRAIEQEKGGALLDAAIGLADALGVSMDWLYGRTVGPDIVIEGPGTTAMVEIKQRLRDAAEAPLEAAVQEPDTPEPIPLEPARRGRRSGASRPRRT